MSFISVIAAHKLTIGLVALGTIALGGTAAAYADALPSGLQDEAHSLIGAPTADPTTDPTAPPTAEPTDSATDTATPTPEPTETADPKPTTDPTSAVVPVGPDASGPAAHGLCTAYEHGGLAATSVAYASLERAAGGAGSIDAYCATIVAPGNSAAHQPTAAPAPSGTDGSSAHAEHGNSQNAHGSSHAGGGHGRP
jgi:hypothetical protein